MQKAAHRLAGHPAAFDVLRWILEAGFHGERAVIARERLPESLRLLDLGCGTGAMAGCFQPDVYVGVDPDRRYLARALTRHPRHRFSRMDGRALAFGDSCFDAVLIGGVIHHLDDHDALALLREAKRVLKRRAGRLVLWEDVPTRSRANLLGRLVHRFDEGCHIRHAGRYVEMAEAVFGGVSAYPMASGVCDYVVVTAETRMAAGCGAGILGGISRVACSDPREPVT